MPVFNYLTRNEAEDVYLYLTQYPPAPAQKPGLMLAASQTDQASAPAPPTGMTARNPASSTGGATLRHR